MTDKIMRKYEKILNKLMTFTHYGRDDMTHGTIIEAR